MPTTEELARLAELGWAALFLIGVVAVTIGLHRRWWVPGWVYQAEVTRRVKLEQQLERTTRLLDTLVRRNVARREDVVPRNPKGLQHVYVPESDRPGLLETLERRGGHEAGPRP